MDDLVFSLTPYNRLGLIWSRRTGIAENPHHGAPAEQAARVDRSGGWSYPSRTDRPPLSTDSSVHNLARRPRALVVYRRCVPFTHGSGCPMHKTTKKRLIRAGLRPVCAGRHPPCAWFSLTYEPSYYRAMVGLSREQRTGRAKKFVAQSLQLRNDICNEPSWEAVFTDQEVNAWLAEDLVMHFADRLPPEVHEPRLLFEPDRIILAFQLRQGAVQSVITVVARPRVPGGNTIELTLEKIRAGILPVPADHILDRIIEYARSHGIDAEWARKDGYPVVLMRYTPHIEREDVQLEELQIRDHQIRLAGRSDRGQRRVLSADPPVLESASVEIPGPEDPRGPRAGIRPEPAQIDLADELIPEQLHPHVLF